MHGKTHYQLASVKATQNLERAFLMSLFLSVWFHSVPALAGIHLCLLFLALVRDRSLVTGDHSGTRGCRKPCR